MRCRRRPRGNFDGNARWSYVAQPAVGDAEQQQQWERAAGVGQYERVHRAGDVVGAQPVSLRGKSSPGGAVAESASSNIVDAWVTVTSFSTPSEPMMKPARSSPVIDMSEVG